MPDVSRSDSQRSDTSLRPRVSFNRDVHVKRIVPREGGRVAGVALSGDGSGHLVTAPVRKERKKKSKKELQEEAAQVISQADRINCVYKPSGTSPEKFYTLPTRRNKEKQKILNYPSASLDRKWAKRNDFDSDLTPPKKPQRTFTYRNSPPPPLATSTPQSHKSIFDIFKPRKKDAKQLRRSVSDASHLKSKAPRQQQVQEHSSWSDREDSSGRFVKKQLSPIIEVNQREDYFDTGDGSNKENDDTENSKTKTRKSITEQLKEYIDEVDEALHKQQNDVVKPRRNPARKNDFEVVIIDLDKAEKINQNKKSLRSSFSKKIKSIANKGKKHKTEVVEDKTAKRSASPPLPAPKIREAIEHLENSKTSPKMMHSSQQPPEKLPLTKGRTVDRMVRRLNNDSCSPPPKTSAMVIPNVSVQHNSNQPFSYTRGLSPEKYMSDENLHNISGSSPPNRGIIYAQVVCNKNNNQSNSKQTVHTTYNRKQPQSDSDEGLGNEETLVRNKYNSHGKTVTHFGDDLGGGSKSGQESPIMPKYRVVGGGFCDKDSYFMDPSIRGRADGMDAKRRESLSEQVEAELNVSARRDLLESRINRKIVSSGTLTRNNREHAYYDNHDSRRFEGNTSSHPARHLDTSKNQYKSTPDIYQNGNGASQANSSSYHDSLRRERVIHTTRVDRDRFGDSGIENDFSRRDSADYPPRRRNYCSNESEDEGFASSLLIASERQHTEENLLRGKLKNKEYDSDRAYSGEDDPYRHLETMERYKAGRDYVPRERSIDDGSRYDPIIDQKEFNKERSTLRRTEKKPPKPEKKSSLEKVKQLFTRDKNKKNKEKSKGLVREESLRARYTEYKGSKENLTERRSVNKKTENQTDYDYSNRRRLSTPSPSPSPTRVVNQNGGSHHWFKSLDRLSSKKKPIIEKTPVKSSPTPKNLRFFGDTDQDSSDSAIRSHSSKHRITHKDRVRSQSSRELHNISEELQNVETKRHAPHHKSMLNISHSTAEKSRLNGKPPASPRVPPKAPARSNDKRRRKYEISSVESSTEGDSSQQSQRSVVYLHAATVGDIPGPAHLRNGAARRASSREELSYDPPRIQPQVKTLSRSFSVLAPWKPRHAHEGNDIDYSHHQNQKTGKYEKVSRNSGSSSRKENSTLKKKANDSRTRSMNQSQNSSTLNRSKNRSSKENLSNLSNGRGSSSTLYKKKEKLPRENSRYTRDRDDYKKMSAKSQSVESLRSNERSRSKNSSRDVSRSISMPKDPEKSAGWFKMSKKNHHKSDYRL